MVDENIMCMLILGLFIYLFRPIILYIYNIYSIILVNLVVKGFFICSSAHPATSPTS